MSSTYWLSTTERSAHRWRRKRLMDLLDDQAMVIIQNSALVMRNGNIGYPFRSNSHFHYLTGFPVPQAIAVLVPGHDEGPYILFTHEHDPNHARWEGDRPDLETATSNFDADAAYPLSQFEDMWSKLAHKRRHYYWTLGTDPTLDARLMRLAHNNHQGAYGRTFDLQIHDLHGILSELRLLKRSDEVGIMRRACHISAHGHRLLMQRCKPKLYEYQLQALFEGHCMDQGARAQAYPPIVASGANACVLHYTDNNARLRDGDLVLVDAGGEWDHYASDITRTFPANGRFSAPQKELYQIVLGAQEQAIACARPQNHWNDIHLKAVEVITQGLIDLKLIDDSLSAALEQKSYRRFFMHRTGHWLGLDVHDVGDYQVDGVWRQLERGMVMTIEPGVYIEQADDIPQHFQHIGIRIEDDVLIRTDGAEVLSADAPKSVEAIEALMRE